MEASNSEDALALLEARLTEIAAVVTDIEMPGPLNGCALAWRVSSLSETVAIIVVSGVTCPDRDALPPKARFMSKPVSGESLLRILKLALKDRG